MTETCISHPMGWQIKKLGDLVEILDHLRVPVNSEEREKRKGTIPYYGANGQQGWIDDYLFDEPLILIAEDGGNFDDFRTRPIAYEIEGKSWVNNHAHILRVNHENYLDFLFYSLAHKDIRKYIAGSTRSKLTQKELRAIEILTPEDKPEQTRIAYVLDTIDEAIAATEAVIAKLKQVRAGMLHDLLTYGLDENGQLRDPIAHPEQFKDSPLGRIPRDWDVRRVSDFCDSYAGGTPSRGMLTFFKGDIPWVKSGEVNLETIYTTDESLTQAGFNASSATWIPAGSPLIAMYGATAGQVTWLAIRATCNQAVLAIVPFAKEAYSRFVFWSLRRVSPQIVKLATGSGQPNLSKAIIDRANIALPRTVQEQELIAKRIDCLVELQNIEKDNLEKLKSLKSGLQDDLLTGRVRVPKTIMETWMI